MPRGSQVERHLTIIIHLQNAGERGATVPELQDKFECGRRTIYRDFDVLSGKFPIVREHRAGYPDRFRLLNTGTKIRVSPIQSVEIETLSRTVEQFRDKLDGEVVRVLARLRQKLQVLAGGDNNGCRA